MGTFFQGIQGILVILIMIALGYELTRRGWFDKKMSKLIARLVTQVALPAYMISTITNDFTSKELLNLLPNLRFPVLSMLILFAISFLAVKIFAVPERHSGLFKSMFCNSNTVFIGLPVNLALFGEQSLPYVLVFYMANTTFFWTLGVYLIQRDGDLHEKMSLKQTLGKIFSPPLLGFMIGVVLVLLHVKLPVFLMSDLNYIGGLTIPLSMIFIGIAIHQAGLRKIRLEKDNIGVLIGRFVAAPAIMTLLVLPTPMPLLMKEVFILQSAMPVMTNAPVVSELYHADSDYAAVMVTETTLLSLIEIPILMVLI
ncbi:AEC family transporter [Sporolactobacillus sp. CPB3-1]|uniref:AEC family transporter n=1 Tax=Sporolactobacillus mangiferae TaxID=2940498 RepID=A0ABT0M6S9_9BACL|nr:AEC family transporter [Sporolactobacillus mangiferae]MCL1630567.1 AEC family transporter [Sporolactobacillus mangiferae]